MKAKLIREVVSFLFIALFIYAAFSKLFDYDSFRLQLGKSPFIASMARWVAWSIPTSEIAIALLLVFPGTRLRGLYAALFMMTLFTAYLMAMLDFSYYIPCSCGGILQHLSWHTHILFNSAFLALAVIGILLDPSPITGAAENLYKRVGIIQTSTKPEKT